MDHMRISGTETSLMILKLSEKVILKVGKTKCQNKLRQKGMVLLAHRVTLFKILIFKIIFENKNPFQQFVFSQSN